MIVAARIRYYHPEYTVTWWDRLYDLNKGRMLPQRERGVDYTLLQRIANRELRRILDHVLSVHVLGSDMVRIDTDTELPDDAEAREDLFAELVRRLRFGQVHPDGRRIALPLRWVEFAETPAGLTLLLRTLVRPDPGLRSFLAAQIEPGGGDVEIAIAGD